MEHNENQFRQIADSMPQLVWVTRSDGYHEYYNRRWFEYTGLTFEQTEGEGWNSVLHPDDRERAWGVWRRSLATGASYEIEYRFRRWDSEYRWFLGRAEPIRDESGAIVRWFGTCTDIHDQKLAAIDLRRANEDLQQFAYAASHDLQEPLRMVTSYIELLAKRYGPTMDEQASVFMGFAVEGARRMESMLRDLRRYWKASAETPQPATSVTTSALVEEVLANLRSRIEQEDAIVCVVGAMPVLLVDRTALAQLFQNLISNGIKYRHPDREPVVEISAEHVDDEWIFHVTDNGLGIAPAHYGKLFRVFSRLHGREYPGSGLGLAICQKIVERLNGRIWVSSQVGAGSRFSFSLPAAQVDVQHV